MFNNRVAVVTGSARGIGRAIAESLAAQQCAVVISDLDQDACQRTADLVTARHHVRTLAVACDVSNVEQCKALAEAAHSRLGSLDIWVNNAGILKDSLLIRLKESDFDLVMKVNLKGVLNGIQAATRYMMKARYGRIVNVASVAGLTGPAGQASYGAAKAGVVSITKTAAREFASRGITVNAVAPGFIVTEMTSSLPEEVRKYLRSQVPLDVEGKPEHVANAVRFLAGPDADYVTGVVLRVDGGMAIGV